MNARIIISGVVLLGLLCGLNIAEHGLFNGIIATVLILVIGVPIGFLFSKFLEGGEE